MSVFRRKKIQRWSFSSTAQQSIYRCIACLILIVVDNISTTVYGWLHRLTGTSQQKPFITGSEGMTESLEPGQRLTVK